MWSLGRTRAPINVLRSYRLLSTESCEYRGKTKPIENSARTLRHLQFTKRFPFEKGSEIQEKFVRANLDVKLLQSKIERRLNELHKQHAADIEINDHEKMILQNIKEMKPNPIILTFQFEPTYTGGKRVKKQISDSEINAYENFEPKDQKEDQRPKFVQVDRGGEVTFHGPGQMTAYIIMDLKSFEKFPAKCLVSAIEDATVSTLLNVPKSGTSNEFLNLKAFKTRDTGVWASENEKVASIGINVRRSITSHGVCINVDPDLSYLNSFTMCGLKDKRATSIREKVPDSSTTVDDVAVTFVRELSKLLGIDKVERIQLDDLSMDD